MKKLKTVFVAASLVLSMSAFAGPFDAPKIVRAVPAFASTDAQVGTSEIELEFDRPMNQKSFTVLAPCDGSVCYKDAYWKSPTVFAIKVNLAPNTVYRIPLSKEGTNGFMAAEANEPLEKGLVWRFKTIAQ